MPELVTRNVDGDIHFYLFWIEENELKHIYCGEMDEIFGELNTNIEVLRDPDFARGILNSEGYESFISGLHRVFDMAVSDFCSGIGLPKYTSGKIGGVWAIEPLRKGQDTTVNDFTPVDEPLQYIAKDIPSLAPPNEESWGQVEAVEIYEDDQNDGSHQDTHDRGHDRFTDTVKELYEHQCAFCGQQVEAPEGNIGENYEVEAAHIQPDSDDGPDIPENRLALCTFHHWAFDNGWLSITDDYEILVRDAPEYEGYDQLIYLDGTEIKLPDDESAYPHQHFLQIHREMHGFADD